MAVTHPSTNQSRHCLTSVISRELVCRGYGVAPATPSVALESHLCLSSSSPQLASVNKHGLDGPTRYYVHIYSTYDYGFVFFCHLEARCTFDPSDPLTAVRSCAIVVVGVINQDRAPMVINLICQIEVLNVCLKCSCGLKKDYFINFTWNVALAYLQ